MAGTWRRVKASAPETDGIAWQDLQRDSEPTWEKRGSFLTFFEDSGGVTEKACSQEGGREGGREQVCGANALTPISFEVNSLPR